MRRVVIIGATGSGKSTLAARLSGILAVPSIEIDDIYWLPDWQARQPEDFAERVKQIIESESWIVPGNYGQTREFLWSRADTIIWIDYSFGFILFQLLGRSFRRIADRKSICGGNYETWGRLFSRDSIVVWLCKSFRRKRRDYGNLFAQPHLVPGAKLIRLRSKREYSHFLQQAALHAKQKT